MAVGSAMAGEATGGGGLQPHNGQATTLLTAGWPTREVDKRIQFSNELATCATGLKGRLRMVSQRREGPDLQGAEGDHGVERALSFRSCTFPQGL